jgi:thymidylate synthase (FAD)
MPDHEAIAIHIVPPSLTPITPKYFPNWKDSLMLMEECGRVSHKSEGRMEPGSAEPFLKRIAMDMGHESLIEHATFTVHCVCSRSCSHQWVRHRLATFTQESQRYCDYSKKKHDQTLQVIMPQTIVGRSLWGATIKWIDGEPMVVDGDASQSIVHALSHRNYTPEQIALAVRWCGNRLTAYYNYLCNREDGLPSEDARGDLDNCCKTEIYTTCNFRQWRHFFDMRHDGHAQWEIRMLAGQLLQFFKEHVPVLVEDKQLNPEWL